MSRLRYGCEALPLQCLALISAFATGACQLVLGFQDHHFGVLDAGSAQESSAGGVTSHDSTHTHPVSGGANGQGGTAQTLSVSGGLTSYDSSTETLSFAGGVPSQGSNTQTLSVSGGVTSHDSDTQTVSVSGGVTSQGSNTQTLSVSGGVTSQGGTQTFSVSGGMATADGGMPSSATSGGVAEVSSQTAAGGPAVTTSHVSVDGGCDLCAIGAALVHRYSFTGSGTQAVDSVGRAHGTIVGAQLSGDGRVILSGSEEYIALPSGIISSLTNATFEAWITWQGGAAWQRVFDFGSSTGTEGTSYLFFTPAADSAESNPRVAYSISGLRSETRLNASNAVPKNTAVQIALSFDATDRTFALFMNGAKVVSGQITSPLSAITDANNWLGHSQFPADPDFKGTFDEFRIYQAALSPAQLKVTYGLGPDASFE